MPEKQQLCRLTFSGLIEGEFASPSSHSSASYLLRAEYFPDDLFENHILRFAETRMAEFNAGTDYKKEE